MRKIAIIIVVLALSVGALSAKERKNIMIIGPSNTMGYTPFVAEMMADVAVVVHNEGNSKDTRNGIAKLDGWLGDTKWDIIQFSFGGWDMCYRTPEGKNDIEKGTIAVPIDEYVENLEIIIKKLRKTGAKLIFATMGYVPPGAPGRYPEDAVRYNDAAAELMKRHGIPVNPIYGLAKELHIKYGKGSTNVHYTEQGYRAFAEQVVEYIQKLK